MVTAKNGNGESGAPPQISATPVAPAILSAPTNVVASPASNGVYVSWDAVSGADSYNLYWSYTSGAGKNGTKIAGVTSSQYLHLDNTSTDGSTFYYVVTSVNASGESAASQEVSGKPSSDIPRISVIDIGDGELTLSWQPITGADSYNLYWSTTKGAGTGGTQIAGVSSPYTHTGLTNWTEYFYVITSVIGGVESPPSSLEMSKIPSPLLSSLTFPDANLSTCVSGFNPNGTLYASEMISLICGNNTISDLSGLENLRKLQFIWLSNNAIVDVNSLSNLTDLQNLWLQGNSIVDVTPFSNLTGMLSLILNNNAITTGVAGLAALINATEIILLGNPSIPCGDLATLQAALGVVVSPSNAISGQDCQ